MSNPMRITFNNMSEHLREVEKRAKEYRESRARLEHALTVARREGASLAELGKASGFSRTSTSNWIKRYQTTVEGRGVEVDVAESLNAALTAMKKLVEPEVAEELDQRIAEPAIPPKLVGMRVSTRPVKSLTEPERKAIRRGKDVVFAVNAHLKEKGVLPSTVRVKP